MKPGELSPCWRGTPKINFQKLAEESFADVFRKHNRPTTLKAALRESATCGNAQRLYEVK